VASLLHDAGMDALELIFLPESVDALTVSPDGRAIRIRPDGSTIPPMPVQPASFLEVGAGSSGLNQLRPLVPRVAHRQRHRPSLYALCRRRLLSIQRAQQPRQMSLALVLTLTSTGAASCPSS